MAVATPTREVASAAEGPSWSGRASRSPTALLVALAAALVYAAFADGATDLPEESWLQLGLLVVVVVAASAWLYGGGVRVAASPVGWIGVGLLAGYAAWTGVTILWSVAPDRSWIGLNRSISYVVVALLAIAFGASAARAPERLARAMCLAVLPVALYAVGGKTVPWIQIDGLVDLDHAGGLTRLRAPLEYWNALALLCALVLPAMLRLAADPSRAPRWRMLAHAGVFLLIVVIGMTYSRGGILAVGVGVGLFVLFTTERVRTVVLLFIALFFALAPLTFALASTDLTTNSLPLDRRRDDAFLVLAALVVGAAVVVALGRLVMRLERVPLFDPVSGRRVGRVLAIVGAVLVAAAFFNAAVTGGLSSAVESFTDTHKADRITDPNRLLSTNSGNRWTWWKEAAGAWSDKPVAGWGAGSFPVTHKQYRTEPVPVQQPHSVPLQFLAETGLVGLILGLGGLIALALAGLLRVRETEWMVAGAPPGRGYAAALAAMPVAWLAHSFYDWDWDIPAVTIPALMAAGVLAARPDKPPRVTPLSEGARAAGLATVVVVVVIAALSAGLPAIAETRTAAALQAVGKPKLDDAQLADAASDAELAAAFNPLAVEPLYAAASIAERRGRREEARDFLLRALERQPDNVDGWFRLARFEFTRLDRAGLRRTTQRALELDPLNPAALALARRAEQGVVLPQESATATGSPLPKQVPITEPDPVAPGG